MLISIVFCIPAYYIGDNASSTAGTLVSVASDLEKASRWDHDSSILLRLTIANLNKERAMMPIIASYIVNGTVHILLWWEWRSVSLEAKPRHRQSSSL
jgi:ABC-type nickel/cobalt efflux system permease component RcnA